MRNATAFFIGAHASRRRVCHHITSKGYRPPLCTGSTKKQRKKRRMPNLLPTDQAVQQLVAMTSPTPISETGVQGTMFDLTNPLVILAIIALIALMLWKDPKRGGGSKSSGDKCKASEVTRKQIDKNSGRYQMILRSDGTVLFEGTEAECSKWRFDYQSDCHYSKLNQASEALCLLIPKPYS